MQAFHRRRTIQVAGLAGLGLTAAYLLSDRIDAIAFSRGDSGMRQKVAEMRNALPADQADGSVLEDVEFDGRQVTLHLVADGRIDLKQMRDGERERKCETWRKALRSGQVGEVEYRYRQDGAVSSLFLDRSVCG